MDDRLDVAGEVAELLDSATLADAVAKREHTELACAVCGEPILPESPDPASLLLVRGEGERERYLVCFTHAGCAASQVVDGRASGPADGSITWTPVLRDRVEPRAALLVELHDYVADAPLAAALPELAPVTEAVAAAAGPSLDGAAVRLEPGAIRVELPGREPLRLDEAGAVFPDGWHATARTEGRMLLLAGTGMGLDRPDAERIDRALQLGRVVGAVVGVDGDARGPRRNNGT